MSDTKLTIFQSDGTTAAIDYRTEATNGDGRQVIAIGDPSINNNVAQVATQDASTQNQTIAGAVVRVAGSIVIAPGVNSIGTVVGITNSVAVHVLSTNGTITIKNDPASYNLVNAYHTANIFTVAGTTSGVSASGVTLVSPSANASFKVFAFSVQTTGVISMNPQFTNGAGTSPTVFWTPLITAAATTSSPVGANLAVTPPGFLFATGTSTTLALLNQGSLIHYSVSYIKESA